VQTLPFLTSISAVPEDANLYVGIPTGINSTNEGQDAYLRQNVSPIDEIPGILLNVYFFLLIVSCLSVNIFGPERGAFCVAFMPPNSQLFFTVLMPIVVSQLFSFERPLLANTLHLTGQRKHLKLSCGYLFSLALLWFWATQVLPG